MELISELFSFKDSMLLGNLEIEFRDCLLLKDINDKFKEGSKIDVITLLLDDSLMEFYSLDEYDDEIKIGTFNIKIYIPKNNKDQLNDKKEIKIMD